MLDNRTNYSYERLNSTRYENAIKYSFAKVELFVDTHFMSQVFFVGQPVEEKLNQSSYIFVMEKRCFLQLKLLSVTRDVLQQENVDHVNQGTHWLHFNSHLLCRSL